jgi:type I pantothenate kinase
MRVFEEVVQEVRRRADLDTPVLVGIGGAVAVGKTTIAQQLAGELNAAVVSTDAFLLPNDVLDERNLTLRKGFPESYDTGEIERVATALRANRPVDVREYSHLIYNVVGGVTIPVVPSDVVIIEGIVALQPLVANHTDIGIYVDAPEDVIRGWFVARFLRFVEAARSDEDSFYHRFVALDPAQIEAIAEATWDGINGPNLREHIAPSQEAATFIVHKDGVHSIREVVRVR